MKPNAARNTGLALVGLAALTIYILACTSFSPDDRQVLYPSFDPLTGSAGVAVYDRQTSKSRMVFVPVAYENTNQMGTPILRPQWLGNGQQILATWAFEESKALSLAVVPVKGEAAVRVYNLELDESAQNLMLPIPVVGREAFIRGDNAIAKLNLLTGALTIHETPEDREELNLYPGFADESVFFVQEQKEPDQYTFGRLNPETFERTSLVTFTNQPHENSFFTYNARGSRVVLVDNQDGSPRLLVLEKGGTAFAKELNLPDKFVFGNAVYLERKDLVITSYCRRTNDYSVLGILEIPLNKTGAVRDTVLIPRTEVEEDEMAMYFQIGVSHDGATAAVSSMYLACMDEKFRAEDCALYLVDLKDPKRKVSRVTIPMPKKRPASPI